MPSVTLRIALWTVNTGGYDSSLSPKIQGDLSHRIAVLTKTLRYARYVLQSQASEGLTLDVFVAPENLLKRDNGELELKDMLRVETVAPGLSKGLLLIPGTVHWRKPVNALLDDLGGNQEKRKRRELKKSSESYEPDRTVKLLGEVSGYEETEKKIYLGIGREKRFAEDRAAEAGEALRKKWEALREAAKLGKRAYVVRNTAYVFYDGSRLLKYHKRGLSGTTGETSQTRDFLLEFAPGSRSGAFTLALDGIQLKCGIEICVDHGTSDPGLLSLLEGKSLDLHFIVSDHVASSNKNHYAVRNGGLVVHASSDPGYTGVYLADGEKVEPVGRQKLDTGALFFYTCTIEI
jgi:predicted amidohydrolase